MDTQVKSNEDNPSIGIILCKSKNKVIDEYALKDMSKPIGIAEYRFIEDVPDEFKSKLPSIEDIEKNLSSEDE